MKSKKKKGKSEPSPRKAVTSSIRGTAVFLGSALPASLAASLLAYSTSDPGKSVLPFGLAALYICSFIAGFAAFKFHKGLPSLTGLLCGAFCTVLSLLIALAIPAGDFSSIILILSRIPIVPISVLGSALASIKRKKRHKRR